MWSACRGSSRQSRIDRPSPWRFSLVVRMPDAKLHEARRLRLIQSDDDNANGGDADDAIGAAARALPSQRIRTDHGAHAMTNGPIAKQPLIVDSSQSCAQAAPALAARGIKVVMRYYSRPGYPNTILSAAEA